MTTQMTKFNVVEKPVPKSVTFGELACGTVYMSNITGNVFIKVSNTSAMCIQIGEPSLKRGSGHQYSPSIDFSDFTIATNVEVSFE